MQPQQSKSAPEQLSVQNSLLAVLPIAALAGVGFWFIVNKLLESSLQRNLQGTGEPTGLLGAIFLTAIELPLIIGVSLLVSSFLAWLAMRQLRIASAGLIALFSALVLGIGSWLYFYHAASHLSWTALLAAVAFVVVFEGWALILLLPQRIHK